MSPAEKRAQDSTLISGDEIAQRKSMQGDLAIHFADFTVNLFSAKNVKNQMLAMAACNCYLNKMLQTQN